MRRAIYVLATLLVSTLAGEASANPMFYQEVTTKLGATSCPDSSTSTGCTYLCHDGAPSGPPSPGRPFFQLITSAAYGWTFVLGNDPPASTLDPFLAQFISDPLQAKALADLRNGCTDPSADIVPEGPAAAGPVYGCSVSRVGVEHGVSGFVAGALGLAMILSSRRKRR